MNLLCFGRLAFSLSMLLLAGCSAHRSMQLGRRGPPPLPLECSAALSAGCRQLLVTVAPTVNSSTASLWMMERGEGRAEWFPVSEAIPVSIGRNGMAWGRGEHDPSVPRGYRVKIEGDGCAPAGVFRIPYAFGDAPASGAGSLRLPYVQLTSRHFGVDDGNSRFYNQVVDAGSVRRDWQSAEVMLRPDELYRWGALIDHNPDHEPSAGSCIFLHIWCGRGKSTAGCTAMSERDLLRLLEWLDEAKQPRIAQFVCP